MLGRWSEKRSGRVGTLPISQWLCEGNSGNHRLQCLPSSCTFRKIRLHKFPGIFIFNSAVLWKEESVVLWLQTKIAMVEDLRKPGSKLETLDK